MEVDMTNWKERYSAFICETDSAKLLELARELETAILVRADELERDPYGGSERQELATALSELRVVKLTRDRGHVEAGMLRCTP
jgi:hypothetical protein